MAPRRTDVGACRCHEGQPAAEAIAHAPDLRVWTFGSLYGVYYGFYIAPTLILIEPALPPQRLIELLGNVGIPLDVVVTPPAKLRSIFSIASIRPSHDIDAETYIIAA